MSEMQEIDCPNCTEGWFNDGGDKLLVRAAQVMATSDGLTAMERALNVKEREKSPAIAVAEQERFMFKAAIAMTAIKRITRRAHRDRHRAAAS